jgi:hypothetical protein
MKKPMTKPSADTHFANQTGSDFGFGCEARIVKRFRLRFDEQKKREQ